MFFTIIHANLNIPIYRGCLPLWMDVMHDKWAFLVKATRGLDVIKMLIID